MIDDLSFALGVVLGALVIIAWDWLFSIYKRRTKKWEDLYPHPMMRTEDEVDDGDDAE